MLPICQGDSPSLFSHFGNGEALPGGVGLGRAQKQECYSFLNGCNPSWGSLSFFLERSGKTQVKKHSSLVLLSLLVCYYPVQHFAGIWGRTRTSFGFLLRCFPLNLYLLPSKFQLLHKHKLQILSYQWDFWKATCELLIIFLFWKFQIYGKKCKEKPSEYLDFTHRYYFVAYANTLVLRCRELHSYNTVSLFSASRSYCYRDGYRYINTVTPRHSASWSLRSVVLFGYKVGV